MEDFVVSDESEDSESRSRKRKRAAKPQSSRKRSSIMPVPEAEEPTIQHEDISLDDIPPTSTGQWSYDPESNEKRPVTTPAERAPRDPKVKEKAHTKEPEQRYPWLAKIQDKEKRSPGDPEYDPRTIFIRPMAWNKFSPFEKQYWAIKQNLWDTIVFFKKGKFYELYEK